MQRHNEWQSLLFRRSDRADGQQVATVDMHDIGLNLLQEPGEPPPDRRVVKALPEGIGRFSEVIVQPPH